MIADDSCLVWWAGLADHRAGTRVAAVGRSRSSAPGGCAGRRTGSGRCSGRCCCAWRSPPRRARRRPASPWTARAPGAANPTDGRGCPAPACTRRSRTPATSSAWRSPGSAPVGLDVERITDVDVDGLARHGAAPRRARSRPRRVLHVLDPQGGRRQGDRRRPRRAAVPRYGSAPRPSPRNCSPTPGRTRDATLHDLRPRRRLQGRTGRPHHGCRCGSFEQRAILDD